MTTILIKKKDTAGAPASGDLTNAAGGAELAVNTATKRLYSKDSGGNVIEIGTNPSGTTMAGNLLFSPDNTYDIGASGATRPRTLYLGTSLITPAITDSGNLTFTGTGNRITGDFSNATIANRVAFQTSTTNGNTDINVLPNGTALQSQFSVQNNSDPTNSGRLTFLITSTEATVRSGISGTGTYLPMTFYTGGSENVRIDTTGNLMIGATSPYNATTDRVTIRRSQNAITQLLVDNQDAGSSAQTRLALEASGGGWYVANQKTGNPLTFSNGASGSATERMRIDSSGNVGIGISSPDIYSQSGKMFTVSNTASNSYAHTTLAGSGTGGGEVDFGNQTIRHAAIASLSGSTLAFYTNSTNSGAAVAERARITSGGDLLVGTTNISITAVVGLKFIAGATEPYMGYVINTAANASNYHLYNTNATNNGYRFFVTANGGIQNYSGNDVNLSDERIKTNIELSGNYLEKICAIPVKLFNYRDEPENEQRTLGVIAQDVEAVAPEFVNNDGWKGTDPEDGVPLKTVYTTDMMFALMKCIQEQQAIIQSLTARITALESN